MPNIDPLVAELRAREFSRLDRDGLAYLDYTGSALYGESQLRAHHDLLARGVFGNPHSENEPSRTSGTLIEQARADVLQFFDADPSEYVVCFTANTSAAMKLVAESYPFGPGVTFALAADNHNSVNGIREYARRAGSRVAYLPLDAELRLANPRAHLAPASGGLFAFPAQSNFSGVKHPLALIDLAHACGFDVLLDAAAFAPSNPLSLRVHGADFVAVSFYKILGYPTGVGALIARRATLAKLRRPWFAGGTVDFASVQNDLHRLHDDAEGFEDGTPDFLNIAAVSEGLRRLRKVGIERVQCHVSRLTRLMLDGLSTAGVALYGPAGIEARGGTVAFNVVRDGRVIPYDVVERVARDARIAVRGGCFCNPGAAEAAFGFDAVAARECLAMPGFSVERFARCLGGPVGAVRASVGLANNDADVIRLVELVQEL